MGVFKKSFSGCWTCRNRKIKCDLKRPFCDRCIKSNIQCEGYSIKLRWASASGNAGDDEEFFQRRNVEFVEYPSEMIYTTYDDMDDDLNQLHMPVIKGNETVTLGPFGVFSGQPSSSTDKDVHQHYEPQRTETEKQSRSYNKMNDNNSNGTAINSKKVRHGLKSTSADGSSSVPGNLMGSFPYDYSIPAGSRTTSVASIVSTSTVASPSSSGQNINHNLNNQENAINGNGALDLKNSPSTSVENHGSSKSADLPDYFDPALSTVSSAASSLSDDDGHVEYASASTIFQEVKKSSDEEILEMLLGPDSLKSVLPSYYVSTEVRLLLKHYMEHIVKIMPVVTTEPTRDMDRNPWRRIYLPRAYSAIGDMCSTGRTTIARNAVLNAILAVSAFHLQSKYSENSERREYFYKRGMDFKSEAYRSMSKCLTIPVAKQKYKDLITAILSMCTIDVMAGVMSDCRMHLVAARSIINERLAARPRISRKAQVLHRIAGFLSILQCSTTTNSISIEEIQNDQSCESWFDLSLDDYVDADVKSPTSSAKGANSAPVSMNSFNESSQFQEYWLKYTTIVGSDSLPEDFYSKELATTYALYGIPDSLILLFSRTTLISRQALFYRNNGHTFDSKFAQGCMELEAALVRWQNRYDIDRNNPFTGDWNKAMNKNTLAFYQALLIYYFRMARNINPEVIQDLVLNVLKHLEEMQSLNRKHKYPVVVPNLFSGFIAACEAVRSRGPDVRLRFEKWFDQMAADGLGTYYRARSVVHEVWKRRDNGLPRSDWWHVIVDTDVNLMLS